MITIRRALLSAYHKEGLDVLARALHEVGAQVLSTGGTYRWLREREIPVTSLEEWTTLPSMFGGRVKTLHPKVHGGILFRRGDPTDEAERVREGIEPIDLVAIHLYPFHEALQRDPEDEEAAIELIDVGGPTMLRAAAKNHRSVVAVCDPKDFEEVARALRENRGGIPEPLARRLAAKVFQTTAVYDAMIARYLEGRDGPGSLPEVFVRGESRLWTLRYGENPSQRGAYYGPAAGYPGGLGKIQGKEISFNNLQDLDVAVELVAALGPEPAVAVIKHATPCGAACAGTLAGAYRLARASDAQSAFGGIVALNGTVDRACAEEIAKTFLELVAAPAFDEGARSVLAAKPNLIVLEGLSASRALASDAPLFRGLGNGILLQDPIPDRLGEEGWKVVSRRAPSAEERAALLFAWRVVRMTRSNGIVLARGAQAVGIGGGQTSRIDALMIAIHKARREGHDLRGAVMASDAFFPFPDCVEEAARTGITAILHPGGSKRDADSVAAADQASIAMVVNEARCFRHG
jgi:phosphoribosylaminoimidazolecarboxamide formyltransferase/IMP cyclohydrolase